MRGVIIRMSVGRPGLLSEPLDGLLFTCVGVPEYASAAGGMPGRPTDIRMITPRMDDGPEVAT